MPHDHWREVHIALDCVWAVEGAGHALSSGGQEPKCLPSPEYVASCEQPTGAVIIPVPSRANAWSRG